MQNTAYYLHKCYLLFFLSCVDQLLRALMLLVFYDCVLCVFLHLVAPYNVNTTGNDMYPQGDQLMLNCLSEGGLELEYSWIFSGSVIANTPTVTINNVNDSNGGDYTCNVTNDAGYDSDTITVYGKHV